MLTRHASTSEERREYEERVGSAATGSGLNGHKEGQSTPLQVARWSIRGKGWVPNGSASVLGSLSQPEL